MFYYTVFFVYCVSVVSLSLCDLFTHHQLPVLLHWLAQNKSCISSTGGMLDFSMNVLPGQASISNETHEGLMDWLDCWVQVTGGFIDYILNHINVSSTTLWCAIVGHFYGLLKPRGSKTTCGRLRYKFLWLSSAKHFISLSDSSWNLVRAQQFLRHRIQHDIRTY